MPATTLLAELAPRFTVQLENTATSALWAVLRMHRSARTALTGLLKGAGIPNLPPLVFFEQPRGSDGTIPDLVGRDREDHQRLIVEAKFGASLTANQPAKYLGRLSEDPGGVLLFLAPERRRTLLWEEVAEATRGAGEAVGVHRDMGGVLWAQLSSNRCLALTSWRTLLRCLAQDAVSRQDELYRSNIRQLEGLCDRMDMETFVPLGQGELDQDTGKRIRQCGELVDEVARRLVRRDGMRASGTSGGSQAGYVKWVEYRQIVGLALHFHPYLWATKGVSPIWAEFKAVTRPNTWQTHPGILMYLEHRSSDDAMGLEELGGNPCVPIPLPPQLEWEPLVEHVCSRAMKLLEGIANGVPELRGPGGGVV